MTLLMCVVIEYFILSYCAFMYTKTQLIITIDDLNNTQVGKLMLFYVTFQKPLIRCLIINFVYSRTDIW